MSTTIIQERWAFGSSLHIENPAVGKFVCTGLKTSVELNQNQDNWLVGSIPAPNVLDEWRIKSVMMIYNIKGPFATIDKIGIRDGHRTVHAFENLTIQSNATWEVLKLELPSPAGFRYGLGITIHLRYPPIANASISSTHFHFTSIGLEFVKDIQGPVLDSNP